MFSRLLIFGFLATFVILRSIQAQDDMQKAFVSSYGYERAQNYKDAINVLLVLDDKDYLVNLRLGWLYYLSGNYANSRDHYQAAIAAAPKAIEPRLGVMLPLLSQARYAEVESVARQVLMLDTANYYASLRLAIALRMQAKFSAAHDVCREMLEFYPTDVSFLVEAGLNQVGLKNTSAANAAFRRVLTLDPENITAKQQLGIQPAPTGR